MAGELAAGSKNTAISNEQSAFCVQSESLYTNRNTMMGFIISLLINTVAVFAAAYILPGVHVKNFKTAFFVAVLLALVNATLGALINFVTFGILSFIVYILMIMLVDKLLKDFEIKNFWWALLFAIVLAVINWLLSMVVPGID